MVNVYVKIHDSCCDMGMFADTGNVVDGNGLGIVLLDSMKMLDLDRGKGGDAKWWRHWSDDSVLVGKILFGELDSRPA